MAHIEINLMSYSLKRNVTFSICLPSMGFGKDFEEKNTHYYRDLKDKRYPIIFLLHGYLNDYNAWSRYTRAEMFADENNIALCMISCENKFYLNQGIEDSFEDFIEYELKDYLYGTFPISDRREDNFIAGLSMGGYGALYHGLKYPDKYSEIGSFSPCIYMEKDGMDFDKDIMEKLVIKNRDNLPKIHISIGKEDFLIESPRRFKKFLDKEGIVIDYEEFDNFRHEWRFWDIEIERFIKKIKRTDYFSTLPERFV